MKTWRPKENGDHLVELDENGMPIRVIVGTKSIRRLVLENIINPDRIYMDSNGVVLSPTARRTKENFYRRRYDIPTDATPDNVDEMMDPSTAPGQPPRRGEPFSPPPK